MNNLPDTAILYLSDSRGIYIPQFFVESYKTDKWDFSNCWDDSLSICHAGPNHPEYWEAWEDLLDNAKTVDGWVLYQEGDLWVVNPEDMGIERGEYQDEL